MDEVDFLNYFLDVLFQYFLVFKNTSNHFNGVYYVNLFCRLSSSNFPKREPISKYVVTKLVMFFKTTMEDNDVQSSTIQLM